jgi:hypothetical protein
MGISTGDGFHTSLEKQFQSLGEMESKFSPAMKYIWTDVRAFCESVLRGEPIDEDIFIEMV